MEKLKAQQAMMPPTAPRETNKANTPKIPALRVGKDEMDYYGARGMPQRRDGSKTHGLQD